MFKIAKKFCHRKQYPTRKKLQFKRSALAQNDLLDSIKKFQSNGCENFAPLRVLFEDETFKQKIKVCVLEEEGASFNTAWEGARALLSTIDRENNLKVLQADRALLEQDLELLKRYLNNGVVCKQI